MITLSTLHDPEGIFLPLIKKVENKLAAFFGGAIIAYTKVTDRRVLAILKDLGLVPVLSGLWGEARKKALDKALKTNNKLFFICDFDKILHWLLVEPKEIKRILQFSPRWDLTIFGRSSQVMATYPDSWIKTESVTNCIVSQVVGFHLDILAAVLLLNRKAARVISQKAAEKSWGSCVEWPLLVHLAGLKIGFKEPRGLTWEDPDRFTKEIKKAGGLKKWKEVRYNSLEEWEKRFFSMNEQFAAIKRLSRA